ncbi:ARSENITE INDUCUBLE RNA ASSOCIATED PROTEIN AIP-1-RELATED [Ceraceosorus bombacis]|uniref:ARSENITE INDUCUBLE RNA ASSOCIATED PROTEIN AIP-1-RELATED n=1 Tax=Ceraceosorus bombacis TaxID=401625 RepID=A0A0P1BHU9_9BASI|nr:ARSENITE INDUCUBLE RNA ASSOCIATED PROTEIN AIP-1-RELATED [Ceraceosorus bombacis]
MGISVAEGSNAGVSHAAPRCERCGGLFCMKHRSATSHKCTVPAPITEGNARLQAAEERKRRAQEMLAKNFPGRSTGASVKSGGPAFKTQVAVVASEGVPMGKDVPSSSLSGGSQASSGKDVSEEQSQSLEAGITPTEPGEDRAHSPER